MTPPIIGNNLVRGSWVLPQGVLRDFLLSLLTPPNIFGTISTRSSMRGKSEAEKVSERIAKLVNDLTLDLDQVGIYLARHSDTTYRRVQEVAEASKYEKEETNGDINY